MIIVRDCAEKTGFGIYYLAENLAKSGQTASIYQLLARQFCLQNGLLGLKIAQIFRCTGIWGERLRRLQNKISLK